MFVLGICGSPRRKGNTDILLDKALEGAKDNGAEIKKIFLNDLKFSACQECENMPDDGRCIVDDDMQEIYKMVGKSDIIILASPIFFGSLSAQTKMMIDRFQCLWVAKYISKVNRFKKKRKGAFISVQAGVREDFFSNAKLIVRNFFSAIDVEYSQELFCTGIDEKARILQHPNLLKQAFELGRKITAN